MPVGCVLAASVARSRLTDRGEIIALRQNVLVSGNDIGVREHTHTETHTKRQNEQKKQNTNHQCGIDSQSLGLCSH